MKYLILLLLLTSFVFHVEGSSHAESIIVGGKWHQEALEAWKEYNKGKDLPEDELALLLQNGTRANQDRFYEMACNKGAAGFCTLMALMHSKNIKIAMKFGKRACEIAQDMDNCIGLMTDQLKANQLIGAKETFKKICNSDDLFCDYGDAGMPIHKNFLKMLKLACSDGHPLSCSLLTKHGIKHSTPKSILDDESSLNDSRTKNNDYEKSWNGKYDGISCSSIKECEDMGDEIYKKSSHYVDLVPYSAKACDLGHAASCLVVGGYEEDYRHDEQAAYTWYKRGCDAAPEAIGICLAAMDAKLLAGDLDVATALFMKVCTADQQDNCGSRILSKEGQNRPSSEQYKKMLRQACNDKNQIACSISNKL